MTRQRRPSVERVLFLIERAVFTSSDGRAEAVAAVEAVASEIDALTAERAAADERDAASSKALAIVIEREDDLQHAAHANGRAEMQAERDALRRERDDWKEAARHGRETIAILAARWKREVTDPAVVHLAALLEALPGCDERGCAALATYEWRDSTPGGSCEAHRHPAADRPTDWGPAADAAAAWLAGRAPAGGETGR